MSDDFWKGLREARAEGIEQARLRAKFDIAAELAWRDQQIETLTETLRMIGEKAHEASTGPAEPDVYWDIRDIVYAAIGRLEKAMSLADDVSGMAEGKGLNPYFEGQFDGESDELRALRLTLARERVRGAGGGGGYGMSTLREAAQATLIAYEKFRDVDDIDGLDDAIDRLRAALAQPKTELRDQHKAFTHWYFGLRGINEANFNPEYLAWAAWKAAVARPATAEPPRDVQPPMPEAKP